MIRINLDKYDNPTVYIHENEECYIDKVNNTIRIKNPEEYVRQKFIEFLHEKMQVPYCAIKTEVNVENSDKRMDIVVYALKKSKKIILLIIECKSFDKILNDDVYVQVVEYCQLSNHNLALVTNGRYLDLFEICEDEYLRSFDEVPTYAMLLDEKNLTHIKKGEYQRHPYEKLHYMATYKDVYRKKVIGNDMPTELISPIINLYEALMDTSHKLPKVDIDELLLELDAGISEQTIELSAQVTSEYRTIYFKRNGQLDVIYLTIQKLDNTTLTVSRINNRSLHNSLELNLLRHASLEGDYLHITHDGTINVGLNRCTSKKSLLNYVKKHSQLKFDKSRVLLAKLDVSHLLYMDNGDMVEFISNIIEYALIRDEYRNYMKNIRKEGKNDFSIQSTVYDY